jgi:hypothetical protein
MDIPKGTKIVCSGGHEVGHVLETIPTGAPITAEKIQIDLDTTAEFMDSRDGHTCKMCQERVTVPRGREVTIHTAWGWLGPFSLMRVGYRPATDAASSSPSFAASLSTAGRSLRN